MSVKVQRVGDLRLADALDGSEAVPVIQKGDGKRTTVSALRAGLARLDSPDLVGAPTVEGHVVWHNGNDGAGSGCDADLLDGREGSWYQPAGAALSALAALDGTPGLLEQTGTATFSRRALGVGVPASVPTRADADARYAQLSGATFAGRVTNAAQPAFLATLTAPQSNVTGDGSLCPVICGAKVFDQGGNYNAATGVFTAPAAGRYRLDCEACLVVEATHTRAELILTTTNRDYWLAQVNAAAIRDGSSNALIITGSRLCDMNAGDTATMRVKVSNGPKTASVWGGGAIAVYTSFGGSLVC